MSVLLLGGIGTGCLGAKSPDVLYYTFEAMAQPPSDSPSNSPSNSPQDSPVGSRVDGLAIAIGPIRLPSYLEHQQIVTRPGFGRLEYADFHRWAGQLDAEILRVLGENLAILLATDRIVTYPSPARFPLDFEVLIEFDRLDADRPGDMELRARFSVQAGSGGDALVIEGVALREPVASEHYADLAKAHSVLLSKLSDRIAEQIQGLALDAE